MGALGDRGGAVPLFNKKGGKKVKDKRDSLPGNWSLLDKFLNIVHKMGAVNL